MTPVPSPARSCCRPRRPAWSVLAAAVVVVGLAGCGAGNPLQRPAAEVEGRDISQDTVDQDLEDRAGSPSFGGQATEQPEGTYDAAQTNQVLGQRITYELLGRALRRRDLAVDADVRQQAEDQLCSTADAQGQPAADPTCAALQGLSDRYRSFLIELNARGFVLVNALTELGPDDQQRLYDEIRRDTPEVVDARCYTAAVFTVPELAQQVADGIEPGDDLAQVAEGSADQVQPDSCFGVADQGALPPEVLDAEVGEVVGPLQSQEGVVVLQRTEDGPIPLAQFAQNIGIIVFRAESADAQVRVDPRYGRWDTDSQTVVAPDLPAGYEPATPATLVPGQ